jgi:hypothetical protein
VGLELNILKGNHFPRLLGYLGLRRYRLQSRIDFLTLVEPKTDVAKLKKLKEKQDKKKAKVEKLPGKKRRRVKLKIKDD